MSTGDITGALIRDRKPKAVVRQRQPTAWSTGVVRRKLAYLLLALGLGWLVASYGLSHVFASGGHVGHITIAGPIDQVNARYLARGIEAATADKAELVVITLDTPGGLLSSTRDMVQAILSARIPVAVYVAPSGAQAASAGTFITAAANFAVMAPGTNIGAASPITASGQDIPSTLAKKINEDTQAFIRSIAEQRGRNSPALEETVTKVRAYSASEAVEKGVVDLIASDLPDLLAQLDGRTATTAAGTVVLHTQGSDIQEIKQTLLENLLRVLANPDVAFVLLVVGGLGILIEFITPGFIGPGVVGVISLALAYVGAGQLSVNWVAVGLILFSMVLLFLELQHPGVGVFGIGALISFVLGALLLFGRFFSAPDIPEPSFQVNLWSIGVMAGVLAVVVLFFVYHSKTTRSQSGYVPASKEILIGQWGVALSELAPSGKIWVADEEWTATTDTGEVIQEKEEVRVIGVYGDVLKVSRYDQAAGGPDL